MDALTVQKIGREMSAQRMKVPIQNRPKFDIESRDFFTAISQAAAEKNERRFAALLRQWGSRVGWLTNEPRCCSAPPCLVRHDGEATEKYLQRCYDAERNMNHAKLN